MQAYSDPSRESDPHSLPDIEVFYLDATDFVDAETDTWQHDAMLDLLAESGLMLANTPRSERLRFAEDLAGYYYWPCFPGCLPDGDPYGPYDTEADALASAQAQDID